MDARDMDMTIMQSLKRLCGAAALAGAIMQTPAEAQRANAIHPAAGAKAEPAARKTIQQIKSMPPRKRSRCYG